MEKDSFKKYAALTALCRQISENPSDLSLLEQLKSNIHNAPKSFVKAAQKIFITCFSPYMEITAKNKTSITSQGKQLLVEALNELFDKLFIEHSNIFFNFYTFLLLELYDYGDHKVLPVTEEYKLAVLKCMISLINSVSLEILEELYVKENIPKFSQIIYVCSQLAKNESARLIRSTAITCIMAMARVLNNDDLSDAVLRSKCADVFMFFLPGLSSTLPEIALEDLKVGHTIPMMSIRAFGRIISLVMQDYNPPDQKLDINEVITKGSKISTLKGKLKGKKEIDEYLDSTLRNTQWYKTTDEKLDLSLKKMGKLTYHSHVNVRMEMANMAEAIVKNCLMTMPQSICTLIEHLIILSQDMDPEVSAQSVNVITDLSRRLSVGDLSAVFESLEDGFYNAINSLPRKFNSIDDAEKIATLNLLIGYIKLFGEHNLSNVLLTPSMLHNLVEGLLHITELEKSNVSLLEEYTLRDLSSEAPFRSPWINFHYFKDDALKDKIEVLCKELVKNNCFEVIYDTLFSIFLYDSSRRKEAIYLMNSHVLGLEEIDIDQHMSILKNILNTYAEDSLNDLRTFLDPEEFSLEQIQDNVIQICLLTEGVGNLSLVLKEKFQLFLLKALYIVLEKAGSGHPLISAAGLLALQNITRSCGYKDITNLINSNFDFFSYHVQRKLIKSEDKEGVLNVLSVVLQYSNADVLLPMRNIIEEVLVISCDRFKEKYATAYLKVFNMFIVSFRRWFNIELRIEEVKSRKAKELEHENFKVTEIDYSNDFSDDVMKGKTAEEMYREDLEKKENEGQYEAEAEQEYKKPTPPLHVELTSLILKRSLHFLPSKDQSRKLLVLEILESGIEILRDWEDELLPVVHQIWSPLVQRFKNDDDPLIMRLSVRLVATLARLSKDFIRMRVVKELLPKLKDVLEKSAQSSYLKDKGSAYRYSQNYKLQLEILSSIGPILYNLDVETKDISDVIDNIHFYLSDKQPQELQVAAVDFFKMMITFDAETIKRKIDTLQTANEDYSKNLKRIKQWVEGEQIT